MTGAATTSNPLDAASRVGRLLARIADRTAVIGVMGLGYVGLPLAKLLCSKGFVVYGFDTDPAKVEQLRAHHSYICHLRLDQLWAAEAAGRFVPTAEPERLAEIDAVLICVPTPLDRHHQPDLTFVERTVEQVADRMRPGTRVILESTTYPGTCRDVVKPILERDGRCSGQDFFLAYSPEREDPGNRDFVTATIPKVVGGDGEIASRLACALYGAIVETVVPVGSNEIAEAVKITENIFRAVNIALVNELKVIYDAMGIDVWHVIAAASTKPFGYMPFQPGPGLGGHCIPIDPFYLTWKAREFGVRTRFIELAGEINSDMPRRVLERLTAGIDTVHRRGLRDSAILVVGLAYKRNVDDIRESPALRLIELLDRAGARVDYFDPLVPEIPPTREHGSLQGRRSVPWPGEGLSRYHAALIVTDHDGIDYAGLVSACPLVVDTRNVCERHGLTAPHIVKA
ncbi:UDP-N-acetyl-D-glucosamine dehydrogenase [Methylobacterium sp. Leaf456]|uniref:nucleotide sugar dehydrogenase n=1 Tax=Methylobacterium sp. Leaf456 TaxID=1736382 RepID=UPI0006FBF455|nr:nucleotide sugar dehydrogenase [Methylobacterium sp. Leaf456]KQT50295.1 UDP-N-acetyl-D-glucosamine dehydrogenase [Methylobacterium sp. Leaf456]